MVKPKLKFGLIFLSILLFTNCMGQINTVESVISKFESIGSNPVVIDYSNNIKVNNHGGHLQGIQLIEREQSNYAVLSGSSDSYAYFSVVRLAESNKVISVNRLMDKPFKHAGGFQIFQNYLAVGIEDNSKKDKSKVCIYDLSDPENPSVKPVAIIKREGEPLRSTAGCVGITKYINKALIAVGDWDTKHLDFYSSEFDELQNDNFNLIFSIDTDTVSKEDWVDKNWYSYQNINLFVVNTELFLIGLGHNMDNENIADLYALKTDKLNTFRLIKLATKTFNCQKECSFKAAAGVVFTGAGELNIISSTYNIKKSSFLNYFEASKNKEYEK